MLVEAEEAARKALSLDLRFGDGLGFHADTSGDWYTCAPAPGWPGNGSIPIHGGGDCSPFNHSDHGTGYWSLTAEVTVGPGASIDLPEPSALALLSLSLMAASLSCSRSRGPTRQPVAGGTRGA